MNGGACNDGNNIHLWRRNGGGAQRFRFGPKGSIINVSCNKALDVANGSCGAANLQLWPINGTGAQQWSVLPSGAIENDKCKTVIDVFNGATNDGTNIQLWPWNGTLSLIHI